MACGYLTEGIHHSVLVEMADHLVVIDGPQDDARSTALIAEAKKTVPDKPIKFVVNTHHHFDHAGGLGAFVADGATIITHDVNKAFLEQSLAAPRTVKLDKLAQSGKKAAVEGNAGKARAERRHTHGGAVSDPGKHAPRWDHHGVPPQGEDPHRRPFFHGADGSVAPSPTAPPTALH